MFMCSKKKSGPSRMNFEHDVLTVDVCIKLFRNLVLHGKIVFESLKKLIFGLLLSSYYVYVLSVRKQFISNSYVLCITRQTLSIYA